jgi:hypothetical protein
MAQHPKRAAALYDVFSVKNRRIVGVVREMATFEVLKAPLQRRIRRIIDPQDHAARVR